MYRRDRPFVGSADGRVMKARPRRSVAGPGVPSTGRLLRPSSPRLLETLLGARRSDEWERPNPGGVDIEGKHSRGATAVKRAAFAGLPEDEGWAVPTGPVGRENVMLEVVGGDRGRPEESLSEVAASGPQQLRLADVLHSLGDDVDVERVG